MADSPGFIFISGDGGVATIDLGMSIRYNSNLLPTLNTSVDRIWWKAIGISGRAPAESEIMIVCGLTRETTISGRSLSEEMLPLNIISPPRQNFSLFLEMPTPEGGWGKFFENSMDAAGLIRIHWVRATREEAERYCADRGLELANV